eukprot:21679-Eustigmatos_ZCMA.PRE.1
MQQQNICQYGGHQEWAGDGAMQRLLEQQSMKTLPRILPRLTEAEKSWVAWGMQDALIWRGNQSRSSSPLAFGLWHLASQQVAAGACELLDGFDPWPVLKGPDGGKMLVLNDYYGSLDKTVKM